MSDINGIYAVDLLFSKEPRIEKERLLHVLQSAAPDIEPLESDRLAPGDFPVTLPGYGELRLYAFSHTSHNVEYADGRAAPAQLLLIPGERRGVGLDIQDAVQQSWAFPDAAHAVASARFPVLVTDLWARGLPYKERLSIFLIALRAIVEYLEPVAIHWRASQRIDSPRIFLELLDDAEAHPLLAGPLNVRLLNIADASSRRNTLMDTMGLAPFELPDIQCHFYDLEVNEMAEYLYETGIYIFEEGDVIQDGDTVVGLREEEQWICEHEDALVPPARVVLDVNPGTRLAAGDRL